MDKEPDKQHDLILSIRLNRAPINLEESLATNDERNECTQAFCDWEDLIEKQKSGDDSVTDNDIVAAYDYAMWLDTFVLEKDTIARSAYHEDYSALSRESCQPVYESLKAMFGENVTWPTENLNMFAIKANRDDFVRVLSIEGIDRVSLDMQMGAMLDVSRVNIRADQVQDGSGGVGPYTGDGVKVAIVDDGYDTAHPRLPSVASGDSNDLSDTYGIGSCTYGHGTKVAGVIFCQPLSSENPAKVGIAYDATPVIAKIEVDPNGVGCAGSGESWTLDVDAFDWATSTNTAKILNFSRGKVVYGDPDEDTDTEAAQTWSLNVDWYAYTNDVAFVHSCGNIPNGATYLSPPSGSYNCISVGAYDDDGTTTRSDDFIWADTSPGPTDDGRKKPDLCAPGGDINMPIKGGGFGIDSGTSFAAPHVAGVCALIKEARPSITAQEMKAVLINSTVAVGSAGNGSWDEQGGWGALDALNAVTWVNRIKDDSITTGDGTKYYYFNSSAGLAVSVTCVWQRAMTDSTHAASGSPGNIDLYLDQMQSGNWVQVASSTSGALDQNGTVFDNVERVYYFSAASPSTTYRVRVVRNDGHDQWTENFTLASRRPFLASYP